MSVTVQRFPSNILRALLWCHYTTHLYSWAAVFLHTESLCDQFTVIVLTSHRKLPVLHRNTPRTYQDTFSSVWPGTSDHYCWRGSSLFPCRHRLMTQRTQEKLRAADQADSGKYSIIHRPFISVVHITHTVYLSSTCLSDGAASIRDSYCDLWEQAVIYELVFQGGTLNAKLLSLWFKCSLQKGVMTVLRPSSKCHINSVTVSRLNTSHHNTERKTLFTSWLCSSGCINSSCCN